MTILKYASKVAFSEDGTGTVETDARFRIESTAVLQQLGVLRFPYRDDIERVESLQIRVTKPNGTVIETPASSAQDLPSDVMRQAPMYSNAHEKQVPVKGLSVGDTLEYVSRITRFKPYISNQFWYAYNFECSVVTDEEQLEISVPSAKFVNVKSPSLAPEVREEGGHKIYRWKTSCPKPKKPDEKALFPPLPQLPDVQLTTFKSWEEVGQWYASLENPKVEITPAIREKSEELTKGLTKREEKQRAIYHYVSTKFRYVSISFGEGRYQPHSAGEVLANEYGDCKDKHTLLAALLQAAGIQAWPVLIGTEADVDPDVPSPAHFDHLITYLPEDNVWLDSTPQVAPYGLLLEPLRDRHALVIGRATASTAIARLVSTPKIPLESSEETFTVESKLSAQGTLQGHFNLTSRGDDEVVLRSIFHSVSPAQWTTLVQNISGRLGFGGTVTGVDAADPADLQAPFHYSYDYERKTYSDWENKRITPPLPPLGLPLLKEDMEEPKEPRSIGGPAKTTYRAKVELPSGYTAEVPANVHLQNDFGEYEAKYEVKNGVFSAERVLTIKAPKLSGPQWAEYRKFSKAILDDQTQVTQLVRVTAKSDSPDNAAGVRDVAAAAELVARAAAALQSRDFATANRQLAEAERINSAQFGLWAMKATVYGMQNQNENAISALKKEIEFHPGAESNYRMLAEIQLHSGHRADGVKTLGELVKLAPQDADGVMRFASEMMADKRDREVVAPLREAMTANPDNVDLKVKLAQVLLRTGEKSDGLAIVNQLRSQDLDGYTLNDVAWALADSDTESAMAVELSERAAAKIENDFKDVTLSTLTNQQLQVIQVLGATWDTVGWAAYRSGDLVKAEKYVKAAWLMDQQAVEAEHLGRIYEAQKKTAEAAHAYKLSLAVKDSKDVRERLAALKPAPAPPAASKPSMRTTAVRPEEELVVLRTIPIPEVKRQSTQFQQGEFFILFSSAGVDDVQFISGDDAIRDAADALRHAHYNTPFPDQGPEKIARRGVLSCSAYTTPHCQLVLYLPANTRK